MPELLEDREKVLENKYIREEELHFKIESRAVELFALWVAGQLGYKNEAAQKYVENFMDLYARKHGMDVFARAKNILTLGGIETSRNEMENVFKACQKEAKKNIENSGGS